MQKHHRTMSGNDLIIEEEGDYLLIPYNARELFISSTYFTNSIYDVYSQQIVEWKPVVPNVEWKPINQIAVKDKYKSEVAASVLTELLTSTTPHLFGDSIAVVYARNLMWIYCNHTQHLKCKPLIPDIMEEHFDPHKPYIVLPQHFVYVAYQQDGSAVYMKEYRTSESNIDATIDVPIDYRILYACFYLVDQLMCVIQHKTTNKKYFTVMTYASNQLNWYCIADECDRFIADQDGFALADSSGTVPDDEIIGEFTDIPTRISTPPP